MCLELDPKFAKGYLRKGNVYALKKEHDKAIEWCEAESRVMSWNSCGGVAHSCCGLKRSYNSSPRPMYLL